MKDNRDVARGWILKAESDMENLTIMMERGKALDTACFHAQQAAEKYLKAFLSFKGVIFPRTHDIEELLGLCAAIDKRFSDLIEETIFLTDYTVELRYDVEFWPKADDVRTAFEAVNKIKGLVLSNLNKVGKEMDIYDELGVRKVINGYATLTKLGGSLMPPVVVEAMAEAAKHFVDVDELMTKVGAKIAELTKNEAAYVCCGAAAGLAITTAACISGLDSAKRTQLPYTDGMKNEILIHKRNRNGYDYAIKQAGGKIVEFGSDKATPEELEQAINDKTAAIFYFYNINNYGGLVPIEKAVEMTRERNIPVIVDAAAQIPPAENLWKFTVDMGADLSIFSGGKGLCGPQSAGLILGRKDLIELCMLNACPRVSIGRGMKVGKEEMVGMLTAVKWYVGLDSKKMMKDYEDQVQYMIDECSKLPHTTGRRNFPSEAGQPMPRAEIIFDEQKLGMTRDEILKQLRDGEPCIEMAGAGPGSIFYNPQTIVPGEEKIIARRIKEIVHK